MYGNECDASREHECESYSMIKCQRKVNYIVLPTDISFFLISFYEYIAYLEELPIVSLAKNATKIMITAIQVKICKWYMCKRNWFWIIEQVKKKHSSFNQSFFIVFNKKTWNSNWNAANCVAIFLILSIG